MDIATLLGVILSFGLIIGSMAMGGSIMAFYNTPGLLIVVGGTIGAALINERLGHFTGSVKVSMKAFFDQKASVDQVIDQVIELAAKARKEGLVALDGEPIEDPFLARGVQLGVDGLSPEMIESILASDLDALKKRHTRGQTLFKFMAATAPSMGMIGTLIGLVQMLKELDDPAAIGPAMAIALLTTLYGAVLAFVLFGPIASKLESRTKEEVAARSLAMAGVESILRGDNSMVIQSKLESFLSPAERAARAEKKK